MSNLTRQFQNLAGIGTVIAIDPPAGKMRLKIDENETDWIPIPTIAAGLVKFWRCPSIGEQFSVMAQGCELTSAAPQISLFSDENPPPTTNPDEVYFEFGQYSFVIKPQAVKPISSYPNVYLTVLTTLLKERFTLKKK
ncbi:MULTISPECIES: phage baseplate assembly protein V [Acinetobacter]|uniref:Phage baseplate assembly protein V n=1 Tax=Acinetobacter genomosp. 15BJ TaxID=106651 RepID=R9B5T6_9GAMM|nr:MULTISPECIES: phage baseplate assembly protein V [Acinetobacter]EOR09650.1 hypothetical protein F896_00672 [Acinetobacter genomosp. 15BJ]MCH7293075.1 phage baseplate assembly protein V [Acinetobacter genomosp. 15BJ]MCI3879260.1 phage baseplate assembly protein V [Acinetobacter higginsii]MDO3657180.1 phage baseplate assembly protein V [Acinetobacter genomosp. 15BJ]